MKAILSTPRAGSLAKKLTTLLGATSAWLSLFLFPTSARAAFGSLYVADSGQLLARILIALGLLMLMPGNVRAAAGDLYVAIYQQNTLYELTPAGTQSAVSSGFDQPLAVAVDANGTVFVGQTFNGEVKKITNGVVSTLTTLPNSFPDLAVGRSGHLFATQQGAGTIVEISSNGTQSTYASGFKQPASLAFDRDGNLFVAENGYGGNASIISKTTPAGVKTTFASGLYNAAGLAFDSAGNLYLAERGNHNIYKFTPDGTRTLFTNAVPLLQNLAFDAAGNLFVSGGGGGSNSIYKVTPSGSVSVFKSGIAANGIAFEPPLSQPLNISTRLNVQTGDNVLIGGFIATGTVGKKILVRAVGPSLSNFGIPGPLQDPTLEVHGPNGSLIAANDNWKIDDQTHQSQQALIQSTGVAPTDDRESALMLDLAPAGFTAIVRGKNNTTGVALVEIYDLNQAADAKLANISTRGFLGTGTNGAMIAGFIVGAGNGAARVLVRVLGPSLASAGISNYLADPNVELRDGNGGLVAANDNWKSKPAGTGISQQTEIEATGAAPSNDLESALVAVLPSGNYTALVAGPNPGSADSTGVAVVEVYNLR
jgi:sugar lactone lactonase YvrE